ncbi:cytochrome P450 [Pisolithus marmoratus]|nr:cytochrome P450 [Pisolithus marmoratus]
MAMRLQPGDRGAATKWNNSTCALSAQTQQELLQTSTRATQTNIKKKGTQEGQEHSSEGRGLDTLLDLLKQHRVPAAHLGMVSVVLSSHEDHKMFLLVVGVIAIMTAFAFSSFSKGAASFPPRVPSVLPWFGTALRKQYGNVFRMLLAGRKVVVVCSASAISSIYAADENTLGAHEMHNTMYYAVSGSKGKSTDVYSVVTRFILPTLDQRLSRRAMGDLTAPIALALYAKVKPYTQMKNARVPLMKFLTEPLCYATNLIMFGSRYPQNIYENLRTLDETMTERFYGLPFWYWPSEKARKTLLAQIGDYLSTKDVSEEDGWLGSAFKKLFRDNNTALREASSHLLALQWAIKENFGDLESFMANVNLQTLEKPYFTLLTSALLETMRLNAIFIPVRSAETDFQLKDQGRTVTVRKGEYILGSVQAAHMNESSYPDHHKFVFDRFAHGEHREGRLPTEGQPWFSFAAGKHLCKGRHLAMCELKLVAIVYLYLFDFTPVTKGPSPWWPPRTTKRNIGIPRVEEIFVDVRPRRDF